MAWFVIPKKMKDWSLWALWWLLLGGAVLWLLVGSVAYWVKHGWLPPDAAGWVQAIGSIAAIVVAFWVSRLEGLRTEEAELQNKYDYMVKVHCLSADLIAAAQSFFLDFNEGAISASDLDLNLKMFAILKTHVDEVQATQLADVEATKTWLSQRNIFTLMYLGLEMKKDAPNQVGYEGIRQWVEAMTTFHQELQGVLTNFSGRYPSIVAHKFE